MTLRTIGCVRTHRDEKKESRLTMVVSMGELALVLADTMLFVRENPSGMLQNRSRLRCLS